MRIKSYSHIAFNVRDMEAMLRFYCEGLGMKIKFTLTAKDIVDYAKQDPKEKSEIAKMHIARAEKMGDTPLITYVEMAPNQFIEFFYCYSPLEEQKHLADCYGYQHLALQVENLEEAYESIVSKGIVPDTPIDRGPDYTRQFWIHDPEGNRVEIMEYTPKSFQIVGK